MRQTVVGVFDRHATARQAVQQLRDCGFGDSVWVTDAIDDDRALDTGDSKPREQEGVMAHVRHFFADLFGQDDTQRREVGPWVEAVRRGGAVVKVEVESNPRAVAARAALQAAGAMEIDERAAQWRAAAWQDESSAGSDAALNDPIGRATPGLAGATPPPDLSAADRLAAGAAINRPLLSADDATADAWRTVDPQASPRPDDGADQLEEPQDYRSHFDAHYADDGGRWEDYEPAYRYGFQMRADHRYLGRDWSQVEPDLRDAWELRETGPWDRFKAAVRHGWERMTA